MMKGFIMINVKWLMMNKEFFEKENVQRIMIVKMKINLLKNNKATQF
jgi:DNA-binding Xre family transcriptional regulator